MEPIPLQVLFESSFPSPKPVAIRKLKGTVYPIKRGKVVGFIPFLGLLSLGEM